MPLSKLRQSTEDWENDERSFEARTENDVSEVLMMTSLQSMCREPSVDRVEFLEIHEPRDAATDASPMGVDVMDVLTGGKPRSKDKRRKREARDEWQRRQRSTQDISQDIRRRLPSLRQIRTSNRRLLVAR